MIHAGAGTPLQGVRRDESSGGSHILHTLAGARGKSCPGVVSVWANRKRSGRPVSILPQTVRQPGAMGVTWKLVDCGRGDFPREAVRSFSQSVLGDERFGQRTGGTRVGDCYLSLKQLEVVGVDIDGAKAKPLGFEADGLSLSSRTRIRHGRKSSVRDGKLVLTCAIEDILELFARLVLDTRHPFKEQAVSNCPAIGVSRPRARIGVKRSDICALRATGWARGSSVLWLFFMATGGSRIRVDPTDGREGDSSAETDCQIRSQFKLSSLGPFPPRRSALSSLCLLQPSTAAVHRPHRTHRLLTTSSRPSLRTSTPVPSLLALAFTHSAVARSSRSSLLTPTSCSAFLPVAYRRHDGPCLIHGTC